ncbi:MAG TPA: 50S ribosomal protein L6 [Kiloniellales bacterium]
MSRVGKNPIKIPGDVQVSIQGAILTAKGKRGELSHRLSEAVSTTVEEGELWVRPVDDSKAARAMWGTTRSLLQSLVTGVSKGFTRELEISGVGYRAAVQGGRLNLQLGYSHDINYPIPKGITITCEKPTSISVSGASKQRVGQVAAEIRAFRPPEPYKGKGIKYLEEVIRRKEGKKK